MDSVQRRVSLGVGIATILLGLVYILPVYGNMEAEVKAWGLLSVIVGAVILLLSKKFIKLLLLSVLLLNAIIQTPPVYLWVEYTGLLISDNAPRNYFFGHWVYASPHIILAFASFFMMMLLITQKRDA